MVSMKSQGKRINQQSNDRPILFALKKLMTTQKAAACAVGCSDDMFRYYLTYAKKIPLQIMVKAKVILWQNRQKLVGFKDEDLFIDEELLTILTFSAQARLAKEELLQMFKTDTVLNDIEQQTQAPILKRIETILQHFFMNKGHTSYGTLSQN